MVLILDENLKEEIESDLKEKSKMNINLSEIIHDKSGKNCYMKEIEYDILLKSISEKLENLKSFCNGSIIIHEFINIQSIISSQLERRRK